MSKTELTARLRERAKTCHEIGNFGDYEIMTEAAMRIESLRELIVSLKAAMRNDIKKK